VFEFRENRSNGANDILLSGEAISMADLVIDAINSSAGTTFLNQAATATNPTAAVLSITSPHEVAVKGISQDVFGVAGFSDGTASGVYGESSRGPGVLGSSDFAGVYGQSPVTAVFGVSPSTGGTGVRAVSDFVGVYSIPLPGSSRVRLPSTETSM
jgi:hypothetical protein